MNTKLLPSMIPLRYGQPVSQWWLRIGVFVQIACLRLAAWWLTEFSNLLPSGLTDWLQGRNIPRVYLSAEADGARVTVARAQKHTPIERYMPWTEYSPSALTSCITAAGLSEARALLVVQVPSSWFFMRTFTAPVQAGQRLEAIAKEELEHRTPFTMDDIYISTKIDPSRSSRALLTIQQRIVRRDLVDDAIQRLGLPLS